VDIHFDPSFVFPNLIEYNYSNQKKVIIILAYRVNRR
jgi:hypothetical protein